MNGLDIATRVALIVASFTLAVNSSVELFSHLHGSSAAGSTPARTMPLPFRAGQKAPIISGVDYSTSERTMVLFLSTNCGFCRQSAPFYRELSTKVASNKNRKLVGIFPQNAIEVAQYKQHEQFDFDVISDMPLGDAGVSGTPTMLLVSRNGTVIRAWIGAPRPQEKEAIASALLGG